ncbi:phenylalanine--tRNA ligase subunit alpha [Halobacteriovorax sp. XZX-3]|uniref:phenylalanine--tRNA ligase subunit alpha n=1 Tax=unclassified Halobacteriovorax TaxID=2639665 RepID=UPI000CD05D07|nr:phenylalanine--tRNA ligase subunit alpha [Halobacteriovorax sp. DA5]POB12612.1 phenylalanine--tRNA ligase subunit alpha [Halobacteriovorax sp. DA5]
MIDKLNEAYGKFQTELETLSAQPDVLSLKSSYLGKKGAVSEILKSLKDATPEQRKEIGPVANEIKQNIEGLVAKKLSEIELAEINEKLSKNKIDITFTDAVKSKNNNHGGLHPRTLVQQEVEDIFLSMGFEVLDGPHVETEFYNFEALNIPGDHPARDMQDTFWFRDEKSPEGNKHLLRTHTSTIQVRGMMSRKPPFRFIAPGTVFRCERTDASHEMVFQQLEGMMVGKDISVSNLIYFMKEILTEIFKKDVEVRLRPGYFPFVEPGFELDIKCQVCSGKGCSVCKQVGWVELLPCGMVHPNVLRAGGIDPEEYNGFAFGLGLDRLVMMKYGIDDIRHLQSGDLRFNSQFKEY